MAFLSIHTMDGDPEDLLTRKRAHVDPIVDRLAPVHGALWSVTAPTDHGIVTVNLWQTADGAAAFSMEPEALAAQRASGLPRPSTFDRYLDADVTEYRERP